MIADEPGAIVIPNQNYFPNRDGLKPRYVVLHGTAGGNSAVSIANYFAATGYTNNPVSSHYIVGTDGTIVQCVAESDGAWANGLLSAGHASFWDASVNPNNTTISIEFCNPSTGNLNPLTNAQIQAGFPLIAAICRRHAIPLKIANDTTGGVTGHFSIDPVNRQDCPGPNFPWYALTTYLATQATTSNPTTTTTQQEDDMAVTMADPLMQDYFREDGEHLVLKSTPSIFIFGGNKDYYLKLGGVAVCGLPLCSEFSIPQYPGVAFLPCERVFIVYDPGHIIDRPPNSGANYLLHINGGIGQQILESNEMKQLNLTLATANEQVATLTKDLDELKQKTIIAPTTPGSITLPASVQSAMSVVNAYLASLNK